MDESMKMKEEKGKDEKGQMEQRIYYGLRLSWTCGADMDAQIVQWTIYMLRFFNVREKTT